MISQASIEALKARLDIIDVVGSYIELKKAGSNFKALCPFHDERTPSFVVSAQKQFYHCFSCQASGDAIKFVQEYEKLTYPETIEKLASRYSITLEHTTGKTATSDLLSKMSEFFTRELEANETAKNYLLSRGLYTGTIEKFELGWAGSSASQIEHIRRNFLSMPDAVRFGIIADENGRAYARFNERVIFPIRGHTGSLVGFGGRTLSNHPAKYVNSPQTELFHKSKLLYGYTQAKESIYKKRQIIITEGYLDVILLHQAGFDNAVAVLGTALTTEHLPLLRRGEPKVILAFDGDAAGKKAALKSAILLASSGFDGGVVLFDEGADPAQLIAEGRIELVAQKLRQVEPFGAFAVEATLSPYNLSDPAQKQKAFDEISEILRQFPSAMQDEYRHLAAGKLRMQPGQFTTEKAKALPQQPTEIKRYNLTELSIVKTLIEQPSLIDTALNLVNHEMFADHGALFLLAVNSDTQQPQILELSVNEAIKTLCGDEFQKTLTIFAARYYENALRLLKSDNKLAFSEKTFRIRRYQEAIAKLKKGDFALPLL